MKKVDVRFTNEGLFVDPPDRLIEALLHPVMAYGPHGATGSYIIKAEAQKPEWEGEWARVCRMRRERHPLTEGGNKLNPTYDRFITLREEEKGIGENWYQRKKNKEKKKALKEERVRRMGQI